MRAEIFFRRYGILFPCLRNFSRARAQFPGRGKADYREFLPNFAGRAGRVAGGHRAHGVFCFPVRLEGAHIARSGTLCRESAARRRLQAGNGSQKPRCKALGQAMWTPSKGKQRKGYVRSVSPAPPRVGMPSAPVCGICGKQNRGKEQEARNHPRPSALSAGNHLQSEI